MRFSGKILTVSAVVFLLGGGCLNVAQKATAETFTVNNVYGDHMVLQQQKPIRICITKKGSRRFRSVRIPRITF